MQKLLFSALVAAIATGAVAQNTYVPKMDGTVAIVKMKPGFDGKLEDATIGAYQIGEIPKLGWRIVRLPRAYRGSVGIDYYRSLSTVAGAEHRYKHHLTMTPNDPLYASDQYGPQKTNTPLAWDITLGVSSQRVAVIDTGIDMNHPEFAGKLVDGYDFSDNDSDPQDDLDFNAYANHGSHCAGIAAANTNNGVGIAGIAPNVLIIPIKVFPNAFDDVIAKAIVHAADKGAKTISLSLGRYGPASQVIQDAVDYAWSKNSICVAGAANDNVDVDIQPFWPHNANRVLGVGSTDRNDNKSGFSNYGQTVDVAAPGSDIMSTVNVANGSYAYLSGTSMSTPLVAGQVALLWSYAPPGTSPTEIINAVKSTTVNVGNWLQTGRVDVRRSLDQIQPVQTATGTTLATGYFPGTMDQPVASLQFVDGVYVAPPTQFVQGLGQVAAIQVAFRQPSSTIGKQVLGAFMNYNVTTNYGGATFQVFVKNVATGKWEMAAQAPLRLGDRSIDFGFDPTKHADGTGRVETIVRALLPNSPGNPTSGFSFKVDRSILRVRYRDVAP